MGGGVHDDALRVLVIKVKIEKKNQNPTLSNPLNRSLRSTHTQVQLPTTQHPTPPNPRTHPRTAPGRGIEHPEQKWPLYSKSSSSDSSNSASVASTESSKHETKIKIIQSQKRKVEVTRKSSKCSRRSERKPWRKHLPQNW